MVDKRGFFHGGDDKARKIASGGLALVSEASRNKLFVLCVAHNSCKQFALSLRSLVTVGISWWRSHFPLYDKGNEPSTQQKNKPCDLFALLVETIRLELMTSTMSTWRSNQLGYASATTKTRVIIHYFLSFDKHILTIFCDKNNLFFCSPI